MSEIGFGGINRIEQKPEPPDREELVKALDRLPDHYFAEGLEHGDIREMADEMIAHWGEE